MASRVFGAMITMLLAGLVSLPLSGIAHADQAELVDGECAATVLNARGEALAVDADELLGDVGVPAIRLGSNTERIAEEEAVHLPVGDVVETLNVEDTPVVGDAADAACTTVDSTATAANRVANTTGTLAAAGGSPVEPEPAEPVDPAEPQPPLDEVPADGGGTVTAPLDDVTLAQPAPMWPVTDFSTLALEPLPKIEAMPDAGGRHGPDVLAGGRTDFDTANTGQVQALPEPLEEQPARAPFVLAVALVAVVAAVLVRRWITHAGR